MPNNVTNNGQYGIFGVALALLPLEISGAAICIVVGACAGPVLAEDPDRSGADPRRGGISPPGCPAPLPPPVRSLRLADAFAPSDDDIPP